MSKGKGTVAGGQAELEPRQLDIALSRSGGVNPLTNGEKDWQQRLPRDLVDEEQLFGYEHVKYLLNMRPNGFGNARFIQLTHPFLVATTHSALLDCLSVDTYVGDLYNFISGSGGTRALPFFQSLSNSLSAESRAPSETNPEIYEDSLVALREVYSDVTSPPPQVVSLTALSHGGCPVVKQSTWTLRIFGTDLIRGVLIPDIIGWETNIICLHPGDAPL